MWPGLIEAYRAYLPVSDDSPVVTLQEGNTPLIPIWNLAKSVGIPAAWYVKYEGLNPTGSFKDRGMTMAISKALEDGSKLVMCASTGNTSAAAAAYAAKANMSCIVVIPEGKIALGKLAQAMMHGAKVLQIKGNFDQALTIVRDVTDKYPVTLVNSINPFRIEGQKTGAFEIVDALEEVPTYHSIPVGNAGNITAYWKGYTAYKDAGKISSLPTMLGWQAEGAAPIVRGAVVDNPETIATAIRIGNPASWEGAVAARDESGGSIDTVTDDEISAAQQLLAAKDGVFCEPASAASVAGIIKRHKARPFKSSDVIVSVLTGHGLKDPDRAIAISSSPTVVENSEQAVMDAIGAYLG